MIAFACLGVVAFGSCHRAPEPPTSLVGATNLPSSADLHKETIIIARIGGKDGEELLNIEIRPTNEIVALHYREPDRTKPVARDKLALPANEVGRLRRMLWRLRPDDDAPAKATIPVGCRWVYDAGSEWEVAYGREDRPTSLPMFTLPYPEYCKTPAYLEAAGLIGAVIKALPPSNVVQQFPEGRSHPLGTYSP